MKQPEAACLLCGAPLVYRQQAAALTCAVCGRTQQSNAACANGHFICDDCHSRPGVAAIRSACLASTEQDPIAIAEALFASPHIHMHGPEHHVLVGAALLTAYHNSGGALDLPQALATMAQRGGNIPGGICGFCGCCGAAVSSGVYISIITQATPLSGEAWSLANEMTARSLHEIAAHGGPRCCKRDSYLAIRAAVAFTAAHFHVNMAASRRIVCRHSARNRECRGSACLFHPDQRPQGPGKGENA